MSRSGDTVRINAQLVDPNNDDHLWANSFDGPLSEMMALENRTAEEIVGNARVERRGSGSGGGPGNAARQSISIDPAAHEAYLRGKNYFDKRQGVASAEQFPRAIDLSPGYASAYSGLSIALQTVAMNEVTRPEPVIAKAMAAANRALQLDPDNGDALIARGAIETTFLWDWEAAKRDLARGTNLSPSNSYGHMMLSIYLQSEGNARAAEKHCYWMGVARTDPILDDLRGDPSFSDVLAVLHLPPTL